MGFTAGDALREVPPDDHEWPKVVAAPAEWPEVEGIVLGGCIQKVREPGYWEVTFEPRHRVTPGVNRWEGGTMAHAHNCPYEPYYGWICFGQRRPRRDTRLHEYAHILAGHGMAHGPKWVETFESLGGVLVEWRRIRYEWEWSDLGERWHQFYTRGANRYAEHLAEWQAARV